MHCGSVSCAVCSLTTTITSIMQEKFHFPPLFHVTDFTKTLRHTLLISRIVNTAQEEHCLMPHHHTLSLKP